MKTVSGSPLSRRPLGGPCALGALSALLVAGALGSGMARPAHAAPHHAMSMGSTTMRPTIVRSTTMRSLRISPARANRIARNYIGGSAYMVRNEGIHDGAYRIHVHRGGVARHVFVGASSGRVIKTRIINPRADRREDHR